MSEIFRVGLTRDFLGSDGKTPVFDPAAFAVLEAEESLSFEYMPEPVDEVTQGQLYLQAMQMTFCQPTVMGLLLFHVQDEPALSAWQSGEFYVDGTPKASLYPVRSAAFGVRRGIVAACPGLALTPKLVLSIGKPDKTGVKVVLACSLDCNYTVTLDNRPLTGTAVGNVPTTLLFTGALPAGVHRLTAQGTVPVNAGPSGTAASSFRSR